MPESEYPNRIVGVGRVAVFSQANYGGVTVTVIVNCPMNAREFPIAGFTVLCAVNSPRDSQGGARVGD